MLLKRIYGKLFAGKKMNNMVIDKTTMDAAERHRSFDSMSGILSWLISLARSEFSNFSLKEKAVLEIGSGKFFTHALGLFLCGCNEVVSIDKFRQLNPEAMKLAMSKVVLARRFLSPHVTHDQFVERMNLLKQTHFELEELDSLGIKYVAPFDLIESNDFEEDFDIILSYAVLEHVPPHETELLLEKSLKALKPGGYCIHFIDLEDHRYSENDPFHFLASEQTWSDENCFTRGNRLRFSLWKLLFENCSTFDWRYPYVAVRNDAPLATEIDKQIEYKNDQDLRTTAFVAVGRKAK